MRAFISIGFLLQALLVLGHAESPASLERRDLTSPQSIHPRQLSKRKTSPRNLVVCPAAAGEEDIKIYLNDYDKILTTLVTRHYPCAYFANIAMAVFDQDRNPASFQNSEASHVRNWYGHQLTDQCTAQKPVLLRSNGPPLNDDDYLCIGTVFYKESFPSKQVTLCTQDDEDFVRKFVLARVSQ